MILIEINNRKISVPVNSTIIQAASRLGITIPTLCFNELYKPFTSCMLCVVLDVKTNRLLPACSTLVQDGMQIDTRCDAVQTARRDALELLFSEHSGDCEAPCQRICPAHMDISQMIREIFAGQMDRAIRTIKKDIPLPGVLGRICSAPCEKGCNRKAFDDSIAICELKRFAADYDLASGNPYVPFCDKDTGNNVAIIGSGPAGLSAAYYLRLYGHQCFVYDKEERPGGQLRYADVPNLPHEVLDSEIQIIRKTGVRFLQNQHIGRDITFDSLQKQYDAIVVAVGEIDLLKNENFGVAMGKRGIDVDSATLKTSEQGVFAAGNAVSPGRMAVRSVGQGHTVALSVHQYLSGKPVIGRKREYQSLFGKFEPEHVSELLKAVPPAFRNKIDKPIELLQKSQAVSESGRCFHCDCGKQYKCKLRDYATEYQASSQRYQKSERRMEKQMQHELVIYEPGKCIKCGLCVQITEKHNEKLGLAFIGRGFQVKIGVPFQESLDKGLRKVAKEVVDSCPTGAMCLKIKKLTEEK